jgi:hypothetical protein
MVLQPGVGRHEEERKELRRNRNGKIVGIKKRWELLVRRPVRNWNDALKKDKN